MGIIRLKEKTQVEGKILSTTVSRQADRWYVSITVELEITETGPSFKGDTAQGGTKPAVMETGITVNVPMFLNTGDRIKVDTRNGSYVERA